MIAWFLTQYHWLLVLLVIVLLSIFGWVMFGVDDDGDWWII